MCFDKAPHGKTEPVIAIRVEFLLQKLLDQAIVITFAIPNEHFNSELAAPGFIGDIQCEGPYRRITGMRKSRHRRPRNTFIGSAGKLNQLVQRPRERPKLKHPQESVKTITISFREDIFGKFCHFLSFFVSRASASFRLRCWDRSSIAMACTPVGT